MRWLLKSLNGASALRCGGAPLKMVMVAPFLSVISFAVGCQRHHDSQVLFQAEDTDTNRVPAARLAALGKQCPALILCRAKPLEVGPRDDLRRIVKTDDAVDVLCAAVPAGEMPEVGSLIHWIKLWGPQSNFTAQMVNPPWTGTSAVATLLNDEFLRRRTAPSEGAFLRNLPYGIRVALNGSADAVGGRAEAHLGQLLKALAQSRVPSNARVTTASGRVGTVADLFQDAVLRFAWTEELEFIGCALVHYLPPRRSWKNQFDDNFTFDELVLRLVDAPLGEGACMGCHVPYTVALAVRANELTQIISEETRARAMRWLGSVGKLLAERQCDGGGWNGQWAPTSRTRRWSDDDALERLTATGHHLEWLALTPASVRPPDEVIRSAVGALRSDVRSIRRRQATTFKYGLAATHAARALCLMRNEDPWRVWSDAWAGQHINRKQKESP